MKLSQLAYTFAAVPTLRHLVIGLQPQRLVLIGVAESAKLSLVPMLLPHSHYNQHKFQVGLLGQHPQGASPARAWAVWTGNHLISPKSVIFDSQGEVWGKEVFS